MYDLINNKNISLLFDILPQDTDSIISNKIFISTDINSDRFIPYIPEFLIIENNESFYSLYDFIIKENIIFTFNILSISDLEPVNINFLLQKLHQQIPKSKKLTQTGLYLLLGVILLDVLKKPINLHIQSILNDYKKLHKQLYDTYTVLIEKKITKSKLINMITPIESQMYYISSSILGSHLTNSIDLLKLFKKIELSQDFPIAYMIQNKQPYIKIYKHFNNKKLIIKWIIDNKNTFKIFKGLLLRYKLFENNYINLTIYASGNMQLFLNFDKDNLVDYNSFQQLINKMSYLFQNINKYIPINLDISLTNTIIKFYVKYSIDINELIISIQNNKEYDVLNKKYKNAISISHKLYGFEVSIIRDYYKSKLHYNVSIIIKKIKNIDLSEDIINNYIYSVTKLFINTNKTKIDFKLNEKLTKTITYKSRANIKLLRDKGIINKGVNCQKSRQPIIINKNISKKQSKNQLTLQGTTYKCINKDYPYIGVTITKDLCCFKKNQQNKQVFKNFMGQSLTTANFSKEYIESQLNKHIITTNKLLELGRLGNIKIPNIKTKLYRIGNNQDKFASINITNLFNLLIKYSPSIKFNTIEEGLTFYNYNAIIYNINKNTYTTYISYLKNPYIFIINYDNNIYEGIVNSLVVSNKQFYFLYNDPIIQYILNYINFIPENIKYISSEVIYQNYLKNENPIQVSIFNEKIKYFISNSYGIIPLNISISNPIEKINSILLENFNENYMLSLKSQYQKINNFIKIYTELQNQYTVVSQIKKPYFDIIVGLKLKNGLNIPVKETPVSNCIQKLPIITENILIDLEIYDNVKFNKTIYDSRIEYIIRHKYLSELYTRIKLKLSEILNKNKVLNIINKKDISSEIKLYKLSDLLKLELDKYIINKPLLPIPLELPYDRTICQEIFCNKHGQIQIPLDLYTMFLYKIANEIIMYGENSDILKKTIDYYKTNNDDYIIRKNEVIILNMEKFKNYIK